MLLCQTRVTHCRCAFSCVVKVGTLSGCGTVKCVCFFFAKASTQASPWVKVALVQVMEVLWSQ